MPARRLPILPLSLAALLAAAPVARATTAPTVGGSYTLMTTETCQIQTTLRGGLFINGASGNATATTAPAVTGVNVANPGSLSQSVGQISFTPKTAGASSGTFSFTLVQTNGSLSLQQNAPGGASIGNTIAGPDANTISGTYATAPNLITITPAGKNPVVLHAVYANVSGGVANTVMFVGQTVQGVCTFQGLGLHQ